VPRQDGDDRRDGLTGMSSPSLDAIDV
jgi:hypothetical protein